MEYIIECRFSPELADLEPIREALPNARDIVLFAYAFADDIVPSSEALTFGISRAVDTRQLYYGDGLELTVDRVAIEEGSIVIAVLLAAASATAAAPVAAVAAAGAGVGVVALWAADKVFGEFLSKAGEDLAQRIAIAVFDRPKEVRNPQALADSRAEEIASARGCMAIPLTGGTVVRSGDQITGYRYTYQLRGANPGWLQVTVDRNARMPIQYSVYEAPVPAEPVAVVNQTARTIAVKESA